MGRTKPKDVEFILTTMDAEIGNELATALEVSRTDIVCGIATREVRRMTSVAASAGARHHLVSGAHGVRD